MKKINEISIEQYEKDNKNGRIGCLLMICILFIFVGCINMLGTDIEKENKDNRKNINKLSSLTIVDILEEDIKENLDSDYINIDKIILNKNDSTNKETNLNISLYVDSNTSKMDMKEIHNSLFKVIEVLKSSKLKYDNIFIGIRESETYDTPSPYIIKLNSNYKYIYKYIDSKRYNRKDIFKSNSYWYNPHYKKEIAEYFLPTIIKELKLKSKSNNYDKSYFEYTSLMILARLDELPYKSTISDVIVYLNKENNKIITKIMLYKENQSVKGSFIDLKFLLNDYVVNIEIDSTLIVTYETKYGIGYIGMWEYTDLLTFDYNNDNLNIDEISIDSTFNESMYGY